ncbi:hypothetical protein GHT06_018194 [Daphnia sinensis]|uniref:Uncharacterized protein n=1 Tax=Daphnia sinensis TaxID=1820382 RepID=A0AAD5KM86_9CRUS|nr:hypothetical protein GHT06_018194 [Daphnia sinensis]
MFGCSKYRHNQSEFFHSAHCRKTADDINSYDCGAKTIFETRKGCSTCCPAFWEIKRLTS